MKSLAERARRLRWMTVPLGAYVVITVLLPMLNGAARRADFGWHVVAVLLGCVATVVAAALVATVRDAVTTLAARCGSIRSGRPTHFKVSS
jgi:hypothetical protein